MLVAGRTYRRIAAALVAVVTAGLLASCGAYPGDAAVTKAGRVTTAQVAAVEKDLAFLKDDSAQPGSIAINLAIAPAMHKLAEQAGAAVSDDEVHAFLADYAKKAGLDVSHHTFAAPTLDMLRVSLESQKIGSSEDAATYSEQFRSEVKALGLKLNPRFGAIDEDLNASPAPFPWLATESSDR